jgi:hypothetical protein
VQITKFSVIAREGGRSCIPETSRLNTAGSGILGRPVKPGDDIGVSKFRSRKARRATISRSRLLSGHDDLRALAIYELSRVPRSA